MTEPGLISPDIDFPKVVLIDTVSYCDLKCAMCAHKSMKRKKGRMSWDLFAKIVDEIAAVDKRTRVWMVFFGEALILKRTTPSIFDMIKYAKGAGLAEVVLNSNGNLLDRETSARLIDSGLDGIYVGIDAFSEETYNKLRIGGNYRRVVQNVLDTVETAKGAAKKFGIQVQFVEMDENKKERDAFVKFWLSKGVPVKLRQKLTWSGLIRAERDKPAIERHPCYWMMDTMSITDCGDVVTCAADPEGRFVAGNVGELSLASAWNGRLRELRELHVTGQWDKLPHPCNECTDWRVSYADRLIRPEDRNPLKRLYKHARRYLRRGG